MRYFYYMGYKKLGPRKSRTKFMPSSLDENQYALHKGTKTVENNRNCCNHQGQKQTSLPGRADATAAAAAVPKMQSDNLYFWHGVEG